MAAFLRNSFKKKLVLEACARDLGAQEVEAGESEFQGHLCLHRNFRQCGLQAKTEVERERTEGLGSRDGLMEQVQAG